VPLCGACALTHAAWGTHRRNYEVCDLTGITETQCDSSEVLPWLNTGSPRTGWESEEGICPLCARAGAMHGALPGVVDEPAESFWVRIRGPTNVGTVVVGVCYRPPG